MTPKEARRPIMVALKNGSRVELTEELYKRCSNYDDNGEPRDNHAEPVPLLVKWGSLLRHRRSALAKKSVKPPEEPLEAPVEEAPEPEEKNKEIVEEKAEESKKKKRGRKKGAKK